MGSGQRIHPGNPIIENIRGIPQGRSGPVNEDDKARCRANSTLPGDKRRAASSRTMLSDELAKRKQLKRFCMLVAEESRVICQTLYDPADYRAA